MTPEPAPAPPALARWLLRRALDGPARSAIVGDLDEEFARFAVPQLGLKRARRWYWRQAIASVAACAKAAAVPNRERDEPVVRATGILHDRHGLLGDVRAALRFSVRRPLTSAIVIVTLAVGVAANTAVFSVINAIFFTRLPVAHADRLVTVESSEGGSFTYPEYLDWRGAAGLSALVAGGRTQSMMGDGSSRRRVVIEMVTANYFEALGVGAGPAGRLFAEADGAAGRAPVVVLSHTFWKRELNADPAIVGRAISLQRAFFTVAGVAPEGFSGLQIGFSPDMWVPLTQAPPIDNNPAMLGPDADWLGFVAILDEAGSRARARDALAARWRTSGTDGSPVLRPIPRGHEWEDWGNRRNDGRLRLFSLFVILILAIACLNVATLLGARLLERQRELAIRTAIGAGRLRLVRQLFAEHLVLAAAGGAAGGVLGTWTARAIAPLLGDDFIPGDLSIAADGNVVLFTIAVSAAVAVVVGLVPAIRWSRANTLDGLQGAGAAGMSRLLRTSGVWWLIPWQVALGTVLLVSAGALAGTVRQLKLGIEASAPERIWFADLDTDASQSGPRAFEDFLARARAHLALFPGADVAGIATSRPLASISRGSLQVEGMTVAPKSQPMPWGPPPPPPPRGAPPLEKLWIVANNYVTPGYFQSMALPIVRGRDFSDADAGAAPRVAVVNETLAEHAFGKDNPIGRRVSWDGGKTFDIEIIGVVRDLRSEHLRQSAPDTVFFPLAQLPMATRSEITTTGAQEPIGLTLVLRLAPGRGLERGQLLAHMAAFDERLFVDRVLTFDEEAGRMLSRERLLAAAGSVLGAIALTLLVVGLYGTLAAAVARGRRELGIRVALGASPGSVRTMVIARALAVALAGLALGLPLSYASTRPFVHLLYGVRPAEPLVIAVIVATVLITAALAAYLPASRAARVDPLEALRSE
jgi:putative ABC transport system permease protein